MLTQSHVVQAVSASVQAMRGPAAKQAEGPQLRWGLDLYLDAYFDLDSQRSHGSGWMRIPWLDIVRYCEVLDLSEDQTERMIAHIKHMDLENINRMEADREAKKT